MKISPRVIYGCLLSLLLATLALGMCGCASTDPENASVRPWNSPMGWENGIPSSLTEGH
ncbi:MAG TPA: hypothetical protein VHH88_10490 [Verrucomicrobiae bacterium]|nr:hypothetical protein [Verrucomicrobiae bacterium]